MAPLWPNFFSLEKNWVLTKSRSQHITATYKVGLWRTVCCIQHENIRINDTVKQISHRGRSQILSKVSVETWIDICMYTPRGSR